MKKSKFNKDSTKLYWKFISVYPTAMAPGLLVYFLTASWKTQNIYTNILAFVCLVLFFFSIQLTFRFASTLEDLQRKYNERNPASDFSGFMTEQGRKNLKNYFRRARIINVFFIWLPTILIVIAILLNLAMQLNWFRCLIESI